MALNNGGGLAVSRGVMEQGKHGVMVESKFQQNPVQMVQSKFKEVEIGFKQLESGFKSWLAKQSLPVEAAVVTLTSATQGAAIGAIMGTITSDISSNIPTPPPHATSLNPQAMASLQQAQALGGGPLIQARNFAVMTGVNAGISCVMKRLRGKEDVQSRFCGGGDTMSGGVPGPPKLSPCLIMKHVVHFGNGIATETCYMGLFSFDNSPAPYPFPFSRCFLFVCALEEISSICIFDPGIMVAAFGSGALFSLVSGMGGPNHATNAVTSGIFFALIQGGLFKIGEKFGKPQVEDVNYNRTRHMLYNLGLQNYEKNFKNGLLTDVTLPLLTDRQMLRYEWCFSALRDVKIPPGPRLLILDHIQRDPELKRSK
ncbi:hypothetical protein JRO89_XS15G0000700 [Xanthoceras sorbifolium]|uniref:Uncharacterized protein n=1 Tax=Xanthoceras sorbifolium TaxID=99658 RepID=A0ABQ8H0G5_9ROSI|nr:hypothetical protein JRO89_XS15G0000700 [Xanthoceras sorbifolium]